MKNKKTKTTLTEILLNLQHLPDFVMRLKQNKLILILEPAFKTSLDGVIAEWDLEKKYLEEQTKECQELVERYLEKILFEENPMIKIMSDIQTLISSKYD